MAPQTVTITVDLEALKRHMDGLMQKALDDAAARVWEIALTPMDWAEWAGYKVRPRIASRQSCLWRHSFDWRNRKRGHVEHRGG
jgi:hypothetical protein